MPETLQEWVGLRFSGEFVEKVKTYEDYNFMGTFIFERAEMTFLYAEKVVDELERVGLVSESIVFLVFMKFLSNYVLVQPQGLLQVAVDLRYS